MRQMIISRLMRSSYGSASTASHLYSCKNSACRWRKLMDVLDSASTVCVDLQTSGDVDGRSHFHGPTVWKSAVSTAWQQTVTEQVSAAGENSSVWAVMSSTWHRFGLSLRFWRRILMTYWLTDWLTYLFSVSANVLTGFWSRRLIFTYLVTDIVMYCRVNSSEVKMEGPKEEWGGPKEE